MLSIDGVPRTACDGAPRRLRVPDPHNRPVPVIADGAEPMVELFG
jgi:hypothetical protein